MTHPREASPRRIIRSVLRDRQGVAAVEFALVASGFLILMLGAIEIGLLWWTENGLQATASLTARCAALGRCVDPKTQAVEDSKTFAVSTAGAWTLPHAITEDDVAVIPTCHGAPQFVQVTITSKVWSGMLIAPLSGASLKATGCYPKQN